MPKIGERYKCRTHNLIITLKKPLKTKEDFKNYNGKKITQDFLRQKFFLYGDFDIGDKVKDLDGRAWTIFKIWDGKEAHFNVDMKEQCIAFNNKELTKISKFEYYIRRVLMFFKIIKEKRII